MSQQRFQIVAGSTSKDIVIDAYDSSSAVGAKLAGLVYNTSSMTAYYSRQGAAGAATAMSLVTKTKGTWVSLGFVAVDGTNMPGKYELGVPDAALAAGAEWVTITIKGAANLVPIEIYIDLRVQPANVTQLLGTAWLAPGTAGTPDVNAKLLGGTVQTGRDVGASVLLSAGTGTGQLDFTSGVVKANLAQILATALTETSGLIAAAFKKFFNIATPTGTVNSLPDAVAGAPNGLSLAGDSDSQGPYLRKYGVQATIDFSLRRFDGSGLRVDAAYAAGDVQIMKDEGNEAATTNGFTDEGQTYSIVLTLTEMQAARIVLIIVDQSSPKVWADKQLVIETYGNGSAQHVFDLGTAVQDVNMTKLLGTAVSTPATPGILDVNLKNIANAVVDAALAQIGANAVNWKGAVAPAMTGDAYARIGAPAGASIAADLAAILVKILQGIKKNTALANFTFLMVDAAGAPLTGLTITAQRSIDGAAFGACANAATEIASGYYKINLAAADLNGDIITLRFTATGAAERSLTIKTES